MNRKNEKFKTLIPGGLCPRPSEANGYWGGGGPGNGRNLGGSGGKHRRTGLEILGEQT